MTTFTSSTGCTPVPLDEDTVARIALATAGVAGEVPVAIAVDAVGGTATFVGAVHDGRDRVLHLSNLTRQRIRALATGARVARILEATRQQGLTVLTPHHAQWPLQLESLGRGAPLVLWVRGDLTALDGFSIVITGTSSPTGCGIAMTRELSCGLGRLGYAIGVGSGSGIDRVALEQTSLTSGRAFAVSAAGIEQTHAPDHVTVVSELPPTLQVSPRSQKRAKPLLAALAAKTVIVEAGALSSALRTAEAAHAMGRIVGVVPGPANSATSAGCHDLIQRLGVKLVTSAQDVDWLR